MNHGRQLPANVGSRIAAKVLCPRRPTYSRRPQFLSGRRSLADPIAENLRWAVATGAAFSLRPGTPGGVSTGPLSSCGPTTCAGGPSPAAWPRGRRRRNTPPAIDKSSAGARNSQAGRTRCLGEGFCCVTTRPTLKPFRPSWNRRRHTTCSASAVAAAAGAPPPRASDAPQAPPDAPAAASSLASDAPAADTRRLGSTAGSTAGPDTSAHTPCAGKSAIPAADPWPIGSLDRYPGNVPWEVLAPLGSPGEDDLHPPRALSHLAHCPFSLLTSDIPPSCPAPRVKGNEGLASMDAHPRRGGCQAAQRRHEEDREGDVPDARLP